LFVSNQSVDDGHRRRASIEANRLRSQQVRTETMFLSFQTDLMQVDVRVKYEFLIFFQLTRDYAVNKTIGRY
jgi:hypothetical protein